MLTALSIRDFVIVERLDLEFAAGFSALTGETGAGKSILIDALAIALGDRAEPTLVRAGAERAEVSAEFDVSASPAARDWLAANEFAEAGDACLFRRTIDSGGRSRAFLNGRAATAAQLRELGEMLLDIHGQHAHQLLLRRDNQRRLLDSFAEAEALAAEVARAFGRWKNLEELRRNREQSAETSAREREQLAEEIRDLESLGFTAESWREQQEEHRRLAHARELTDAAEGGIESLSDAQVSAEGLLEGVLATLKEAASLDPKLGEALRAVESALIDTQEAARELRHYLHGLDLDPARLDALDRRLHDVLGLARKLRIDPHDLPPALDARRERLQSLGGEDSLEALKRQEGEAEQAYRAFARKLSAQRRGASTRLSPRVTESMQALAMKGGAFSVSLEPLAVPGPHGLESVEFLVTANAGQPPGPLAKVASGGELSRVSLAIQVLMSGGASVSTLIFDEVDAGIGGSVAEIVGRLLDRLGSEHQVLCVTHLPQVAAWARHQFRVTKHDTPRGAAGEVEPLDADERVEEIARMLGGMKITEATRRHAAEMLGAAATGRAGAKGRSRSGARQG